MTILFARLASPGRLLVIFCFFSPFLSPAHGGECLDSRDTMLTDYRMAVQQAIANPEGDHGLGPWIEHCWYYWDPQATDYLDDSLADEIIKTLADSRVPDGVKATSIAIATNAAPRRLFAILPGMMAQNKIPQQLTEECTDIMLSVWAVTAKPISRYLRLIIIHFLRSIGRPSFNHPPTDSRFCIKNSHIFIPSTTRRLDESLIHGVSCLLVNTEK